VNVATNNRMDFHNPHDYDYGRRYLFYHPTVYENLMI
jgi:hypothetical protein